MSSEYPSTPNQSTETAPLADVRFRGMVRSATLFPDLLRIATENGTVVVAPTNTTAPSAGTEITYGPGAVSVNGVPKMYSNVLHSYNQPRH